MKLLLDAEGCVLWHCTAGKDRAGIASALIEEILGVDRKEIIADYLLTNEYLKKDVSSLIRFIKKMNGTDSELADEALGYLLGAKEEYIMSFYSAAEERYGSFDGFVRHGLGIGDSEKQALREKYLEVEKQKSREEPYKDNASDGNAGSIANMERIDYLTLLAEQMNL